MFIKHHIISYFQIWSLSNYKCHYTFTGEHSRHGIFKNISQGVSQVMVDEHNRLFSCGADGSMKVRQLPDRDIMFNNFVSSSNTECQLWLQFISRIAIACILIILRRIENIIVIKIQTKVKCNLRQIQYSSSKHSSFKLYLLFLDNLHVCCLQIKHCSF